MVKKLVCGAGVNDADYSVKIHKSVNGAMQKVWFCPFYITWCGMLTRAYSEKYKRKYPTYSDVVACKEWHLFSTFKAWMELQDWQGKHLDKDLLIPGNKEYRPDACVFLDKPVNSFMLDNLASRGEHPIGVCWHKRDGLFIAKCCNPFTRKQEWIGSFKCPDKAHIAWKRHKHELACQLADTQKDQRVAEALRTRYLPEVKP